MGTKIPEGRAEGSHTERPRTEKQENQRAPQQKGAAPLANQKSILIGRGNRAPGTSHNLNTTNWSDRITKGSVKSGLPPLDSLQKEALPEKGLELPDGKTVPAQELFKQIAAALGLPQDSLSVSLIAFLRFFSLSADPDVLKVLRREILPSASSSPKSAREKAALEAKALAETIAFDKGVDLSQEVLELLARYLLPAVFDENDKDKEPGREKLPNTEELENIAKEQSRKEKFLDFLNSLPGKSGKKWLVFPFKINVKGTVLSVFLRLLKREPFFQGESEYLIVDIAGPKRQWRFFAGKIDGKVRIDINVYPGLPAKALEALEREAKRFFAGEVRMRNREEVPSWMEDLCDEILPSVNEEV